MKTLPTNTPKLTAPILWIAGTKDPLQLGLGYAFDKAPKSPLDRYVTVDGDHQETPPLSGDAILAWLKDLIAQ